MNKNRASRDTDSGDTLRVDSLNAVQAPNFQIAETTDEVNTLNTDEQSVAERVINGLKEGIAALKERASKWYSEWRSEANEDERKSREKSVESDEDRLLSKIGW